MVERGAAVGGRGGLGGSDALASAIRWATLARGARSSIDKEAFEQRQREASRRGRPLGDEEFVESLKTRCGRRLRARPVGRPKKVSGKEEDHLSFGYGV